MKPLVCCIALLFLASCRTVLPPERPVAYMYPTVCPAAILAEMHPVKLSQQDLRDAFATMNLISDIDNSGMLATDFLVILRSLAKRGYAEIDARRCNLPWQWISLSVPVENTLQVVCGFNKLPSKKYSSIDTSNNVSQSGYRHGANGIAQPVQIWTTPAYSLIHIKQPNSTKTSHWEMMRLIPISVKD